MPLTWEANGINAIRSDGAIKNMTTTERAAEFVAQKNAEAAEAAKKAAPKKAPAKRRAPKKEAPVK